MTLVAILGFALLAAVAVAAVLWLVAGDRRRDLERVELERDDMARRLARAAKPAAIVKVIDVAPGGATGSHVDEKLCGVCGHLWLHCPHGPSDEAWPRARARRRELPF